MLAGNHYSVPPAFAWPGYSSLWWFFSAQYPVQFLDESWYHYRTAGSPSLSLCWRNDEGWISSVNCICQQKICRNMWEVIWNHWAWTAQSCFGCKPLQDLSIWPSLWYLHRKTFCVERLSGKLAKWVIVIQQLDIQILHRSGERMVDWVADVTGKVSCDVPPVNWLE